MAIITIPTSIGGVNIPGGLLNGPLSALFQTDTLDYVKYPRDLESSTRSHVVLFTISEVKETTLEQAQQYATNSFNSFVGNAQTTAATAQQQGLTGTVQNVVGAISSAADSVQNFFGNFAGNVTAAGTKLNQVREQFTTKEVTPKAYIALYMPETMTFTYSPEYDDSVTLASAAGALPLVGGVASMLTNTLEGNDAARLALNKLGYVFNPNKQLLFKGINFRTFQMSFTFTPYSKDEADSVKKIIQLFRTYAAPTIVTEGAGMFFKAPGVFDLDFKFNGSTNENIPKFKRSVITNVDVNYAPNGWSTHSDGAPVQTTITLDFQEMVLVDSKAINSGF